MAKDGSRVTVGGAPSDESPREAEAHLRRILDIVARHGATDVQGIMSVEGVISPADYDKLAADKNVFLVDVTRSAVLQRLSQLAPQARVKIEAIMYHQPSLTWKTSVLPASNNRMLQVTPRDIGWGRAAGRGAAYFRFESSCDSDLSNTE